MTESEHRELVHMIAAIMATTEIDRLDLLDERMPPGTPALVRVLPDGYWELTDFGREVVEVSQD